jgi:methane/ammonia monooxygenase subunit C
MNLTKVDTAVSEKNAQKRLDLRPLFIGTGALILLVLILRLYEQLFAWTDGLDAFSSEFQTHWTNLLKFALFFTIAAFGGSVAYLWKTRDKNLALVSPETEITRLIYLIQWLVVFALALYFGLSFFSEQTAVWHMTAIRDTDFTPSNIITFYIAYPTFAIIGASAFLYAKTRIPYFAEGYSLAFGILVVGVFMTIPNVGFNEWGHTAWIMDEGFAGPLHWGFVFFGWMSLGIFGVVLQILMRIHKLLGAETMSSLLKR